jgi:hypothetical protein
MQKLSLCAALAAIGLAGTLAVPAGAEPLRLAQATMRELPPAEAMPPVEVISLVRSMDFDPISRPVLRGRLYMLRAVDGGGAEVRVAVDALVGRIVSVRPVRLSDREIDVRRRPAWRGDVAPWGRRYVPEWGEAPPSGSTPSGRRAALPTGPSVIYGPDGAPTTHPRHASRAPASHPISHPPVPKARPNEIAAVGKRPDTTPAAKTPAAKPAPAQPAAEAPNPPISPPF